MYQWVSDWQEKLRHSIEPQTSLTLQLKQVYVLPTRFGCVFLLFCLATLLLAINYANSLVYIIVFWLASMFCVAIFKTWHNLVGIHLQGNAPAPIFVDDEASFPIVLESYKRSYHAIAVSLDTQTIYLDCPKKSNIQGHLFAYADERGILSLPRFKISTTYPLGLIQAWSYIDLDQHIICYPKPLECPFPIGTQVASEDTDNSDHSTNQAGVDIYEGLKSYQVGDNISRIHWPAFAKGQGLYIKQFNQAASADFWIDYFDFSGHLEDRLSKMCYWVLQLHDAQKPFGIRLGTLEIEPNHSASHLNECLKALALFEGQR